MIWKRISFVVLKLKWWSPKIKTFWNYDVLKLTTKALATKNVTIRTLVEFHIYSIRKTIKNFWNFQIRLVSSSIRNFWNFHIHSVSSSIRNFWNFHIQRLKLNKIFWNFHFHSVSNLMTNFWNFHIHPCTKHVKLIIQFECFNLFQVP